MRCTQFIGLTQAAELFVSNLDPQPSRTKARGMFDEEIPLGSWTDGTAVYNEVVQATPWSSGPMIFTKLRQVLRGDTYFDLYCWVMDPTVEGQEYDPEKGTFWV